MNVDCAIIGGGPAGLQSALTLGRSRRSAVLFDDNRPRNAVTQEAHNFLTRDGIKPAELRRLAQQDISKYPSIELRKAHVTAVSKLEDGFELVAEDGSRVQASTVILATGLKETLPAINDIHDFYGKSLFSCPYCDGWERKDDPLIAIAAEGPVAFHLGKLIWNWSRDLVLCTNGNEVLSQEQKDILHRKDIRIIEDRITALVGSDGMLERVVFANHGEIARKGGFVATQLAQASAFAVQLGCETNATGGIVVDQIGRASVKGVYVAGEGLGMPSKLIISAAQGSMAAVAVNMDLLERTFEA